MDKSISSGIDSPDIIKHFSNPISYFDWLEKLGQPLSKTVVNIPARSYSKRLPNKNIKKINGIPLLAYSIIIAKNMPAVDRIFVNTDSPEYASIAIEFGAEAPFLRPKELSQDSSSMAKANHFLSRYLMEEDYPLSSLINLYPTSPFRNVTIMNQLAKFLSSHVTVTTCIDVDYTPEKICMIDGEQLVKPGNNKNICTNNLFYKTTGSFIGINRRISSRGKGVGLRQLYFHKNLFEAIDIDTIDDFKIAEEIIKHNLYDFGVPICT